MQLLIIFIGFIFLLNKGISGRDLELPIESCANALFGGDITSCTQEIASIIFKLHQWGPKTNVQICGHSCRGSLKGRLSKWDWKWDGKFQCDSQAPGVIGTSTRLSRKGAIEWAIKDYIDKSINEGHFQLEDLNCCNGKHWSFCTSY